MLIELSYFQRLIKVASLEKPAIAETVNEFIVQYEPEYLQKMLGYQLAQDFMTGLQQDVIEQKWIDLLLGATYDVSGTTQKWNGFAASYTYPNIGADASLFNWIVGTAGSPVAGAVSFTEKRLIGRKFFIERNGTGTMVRLLDDNSNADIADYSSDMDGTVTLLKEGVTFQPNEVYTIHFTGYTGAVNLSAVNISPIAYYVFFKMTSDLNQQQSGLGVQSRPKAENAEIVSPFNTMVSVWNKMVDLNRSLSGFLSVNNITYGYNQSGYIINSFSYRRNGCGNELLEKINFAGT